MKSIFIFVAVCLFSLIATASGPSYQNIEVDVKGSAEGLTEAVACEAAKSSKEVSETVQEFMYTEQVYDESYDVESSKCSCASIQTGFNCTYEATFNFVVEVWYP